MIEVTYTLTADEFSQSMLVASRKIQKGMWRLRLYLCIALPIALICPAFSKAFTWHTYVDGRILFVAVLFLTCLSLPSITARSARKQFSKLNSMFTDVHLRLDDEGYHAKQPGLTQADLQWSAFTGWKEDKNVVLLFRQSATFILPRRAFAASQMEDLRTLLTRHLPS